MIKFISLLGGVHKSEQSSSSRVFLQPGKIEKLSIKYGQSSSVQFNLFFLLTFVTLRLFQYSSSCFEMCQSNQMEERHVCLFPFVLTTPIHLHCSVITLSHFHFHTFSFTLSHFHFHTFTLSICPHYSHSFALICDPFNGFASFNLGPFSLQKLNAFVSLPFLPAPELSSFCFFPPQEFLKQAMLLLPT